MTAQRKPHSIDTGAATERRSIRLDLASGAHIGPDLVAVLEEFACCGSFSAAGHVVRTLHRRTWELVEDRSQSLGATRGRDYGVRQRRRWRVLMRAGKAATAGYRAMEADTALAAHKHLQALHGACSEK